MCTTVLVFNPLLIHSFPVSLPSATNASKQHTGKYIQWILWENYEAVILLTGDMKGLTLNIPFLYRQVGLLDRFFWLIMSGTIFPLPWYPWCDNEAEKQLYIVPSL
jgi:hypothetical protein